MTFRSATSGGNCTGCEWIVADGDMTADTPGKFESFLKKSRAGGFVLLNSNGGSLLGGVELGRVIRKYQLHTSVGKSTRRPSHMYEEEITKGNCLSSCAFAFLGGVSRTAEPNEIGVHQFFSERAVLSPNDKQFSGRDLSVQQVISGLLIDYTNQMGVDSEFVSLAFSTPPENIRFFSLAELKRLKVVFEPEEFQPWSLEPQGNGIVGVSLRNDKKASALFYCTADKRPRIRFVKEDRDSRGSYNFISEAISDLDSITIFGNSYSKENVSPVIQNRASGFEILLTRFDLKKIGQLKREHRVDPDIYRAARPIFETVINLENAVSVFSAALKNCLRS
jgi:hypothetical protein